MSRTAYVVKEIARERTGKRRVFSVRHPSNKGEWCNVVFKVCKDDDGAERMRPDMGESTMGRTVESFWVYVVAAREAMDAGEARAGNETLNL